MPFLHILAHIGCYYFLPPWDKSKLWITKPRTHHCYPFSWISCDTSSGPHFMPTLVSSACAGPSAWNTVPHSLALKILLPLCSHVKHHLLKEPLPDGADRIRDPALLSIGTTFSSPDQVWHCNSFFDNLCPHRQ